MSEETNRLDTRWVSPSGMLSDQVRTGGVDNTAQTTLKAPIDCSGIGLHSGEQVGMTLCPAEPDTGIVFRRIDLKNGARDIPARFDAVCDTRLCTTLTNDHGSRVATVEHLMAAFAGCGIDNAIVELDAPEVPVMDGSSEPFVFLIECTGVVRQKATRRVLRIDRPVAIEDGASRAALEPADGFTIGLDIEFQSRAIGRQELFLEVTPDTFRDQIARARTFGFLHEVEAMRKAGLGLGGSLENAVVVDGDRVINEDGLRFEDEFVRHKVLDCIGDMALAGHSLRGHLRGRRCGHAINNRLLRALFADKDNYALVPATDLAVSPS
ncbi:UDP-3-O-acyl-N-acetylglucosamine deacetylase [Marivibrio halodurans]|uniref:UDP-3-O-acyl-N-acetylglucosamine deacetylase n=1 Tax=Marivibrio halodurans TaxID=2039722 RepID=A0A8J7SJH1_9PROT|nr:UDP-3-O-acyl-N-acetylglucosamine deacetylase [Marivibrio halodurans]MBP5857738.1 UDP-3-O-acyl-N-acetylglucosamine deacetylase [Marivibrio halodurans]